MSANVIFKCHTLVLIVVTSLLPFTVLFGRSESEYPPTYPQGADIDRLSTFGPSVGFARKPLGSLSWIRV